MVSNRTQSSRWRQVLVGTAVAVVGFLSSGPKHVTLVGSAHAQSGDSGSIIGYIFDQAGNPLAGVKVTASSPSQIGGNKTAYTNAEGAFRFHPLAPGKFRVKAEAPKLQTVVQDGLAVGITAPTEVNLIMEVAQSKVEEVKIVAKAPLVNTSKPNVKEVFDVDFVDQMPHDNRDVIFQQITNYVAGAIRGGRVRGGSGNQTLYMMDGFNMLRQFPTVKASAAYEVQTAGYGADNATAPGSVVNLVTRSGSNKFEFELGATADSSVFTFFEDETDPRASSHFFVLNPTISGPIIKDKLWYSANVEFLTRKTGRENDPQGVLPEPDPEIRHWYKGTWKLAWQITPRNKLQSVNNFDEFYMFNRLGINYTRDADANFRSRNYFSGLIWEALLTDNIVFRSQVGVSNTERKILPKLCDERPDDCEFVPSVQQNAYGGVQGKRLIDNNVQNLERTRTYSLQFVNRLEFFWDHKVLGEHHIQIKDHFMTQGDVVKRAVPGDRIEELNTLMANGREALTEYYSNDPRVDPARYGWFITNYTATRNSISISDQWRPTRYLTLTPALAYTNAWAENSRAEPIMNDGAFTPSFSVAWDATHDGRTALRSSWAQYVDVDLSAIGPHNLGTQVGRRCKWNPASQAYDLDCEYSGGQSGATIGLPCGPQGIDEQGRNCATSLVIPRTHEFTVGAEREVMEGLSLAVDGIYRKFVNQFEKFETNRIWNGGGNALDRTGGYRNGKAGTVSDLQTPDSAWRRYVGVTGSVTRREGKFKLQGSYTWSRLEGTVLDGTAGQLGDIGPRDRFLVGPLGDDHRHEIKAQLSYRFNAWLATSMRYSYYSGLPASRRFRNDATGQYEDLKSRVGTNPGNDINDPADDREFRLPDIQSLNIQLAFNFQPLIGQNLEAFVDGLNILGLRTPNAVDERDGPLFGAMTGREPAMRLRFGMRYRY